MRDSRYAIKLHVSSFISEKREVLCVAGAKFVYVCVCRLADESASQSTYTNTLAFLVPALRLHMIFSLELQVFPSVNVDTSSECEGRRAQGERVSLNYPYSHYPKGCAASLLRSVSMSVTSHGPRCVCMCM